MPDCESRLHRRRGQSTVEFALVLPVLLLLVLIGLDFGRVYLGWINLQQVARLAANFAANHSSAWPHGGDPDKAMLQVRYETLIASANQTNCNLVGDTEPSFSAPSNPRPTGSEVTVELDCEFALLTPLLGNVVGNPITASASATFPVKEGIVVGGQTGGGGTTPPPVADFIGSPRSGWAPLTVTFSDLSFNAPGSWQWNFNVGPSGSGTGSASPAGSTASGPVDVVFDCLGAAGDTCTFGVSLRVANTAGTDIETKPDYITVTVLPDDGPIAEFTGSPTSGAKSVTVSFQFENLNGSSPISWDWNFGDGTIGSGPNVTHTYTNSGTTDRAYDVTLTVSDGTASSSLTKVGYIIVTRSVCVVPDFANVHAYNASALWTGAGFSAGNLTIQGSGNFKIKTQTIAGGTIDPQPDGCSSRITVGAK